MSQVKCTHCHLEFDDSVMIKEDKELFFCCNGCQGVYHLLKDDGLESFYDKMGNNTIAPPIVTSDDSQNFDMESFKQRYIKTTPDGFSQVDLIIEGIHCAACIWLNEKVLHDTDGIVDVSINFTNNKAKIIWDEEIIALSSIIHKIRSIGYNAYPYDQSEGELASSKKNRDYMLRMSVAVFGSMNIMMIGVAKYTGFFTGMKEEMIQLVHMAEFIFSTPVLFFSGWIFFKGAYFGLKNKIVNMDFLVSAGATLTYIYSLYVLFGGEGHSYFDSVAMIITFVLVGKYLEVIGKKGAVDTMDKIKSQIPTEATVIEDSGKKTIALDQIKIGDILEVKTGEKASVDGELQASSTTFDESSISGESLPVLKKQGDTIYSGTINTGNVIRYEASKNYANSTLNSIVSLLEDSLASKPEIENTANELSKYFSVIILSLAMISFAGWYFYEGNFESALIIAISVIVIACPCALALATPIASLVGVSWLAQKGLLFKEAKFIETFAKADTIVLDKTGTLTQGKLSVVNAQISDMNQEELNLLFSLTDSSTHPVSQSIKRYLNANFENLKHLELHNIEQIPAVGLSCMYKTLPLFGGKLQDNEDNDYTSYAFTINDVVMASFDLEDTIKPHAKQLIEYFKNHNITPIMLTGDNANVAAKIARDIGIDNYESHMTPLDKANYINQLKKNDKTVVMAGDGVNDALALSRSDVAIAMGNGADISIAISDVVILNDSLKGLQESFYISKRTFGFIKQNLSISLVYNIITIPIAMAGYVIPLVAALSMSLSSLLVVGNSMRIKKRK
ncbi:MAG: heavy metal translocating P-type ATPase [Campylobacterota bacterium]|nr:heavy metal translocating P-type ATPase [Campylobacterota bacterium]